jgi:mono/diheme cytochrome c family protein
MKKAIKWTLIILGGLTGLLVAAVLVMSLLADSRLGNAKVAARAVAAASDEAAKVRGEHLVRNVAGCMGCHGPNLEGKVLLEDPMIGYLAAPNLTRGAGGIGSGYTMDDWVRALRHGVGADGRALGAMPSHFYAHLSDADLAAMVAYMESLPPVDKEHPARSLSLVAKIIFGVIDYQNLPVALINHETAGSSQPVEGATAEYGEYIATIAICADCHGAGMVGRSEQDAEMGPPAGPKLNPAGRLRNWDMDQFKRALRTGQTPEGRQLNAEEMPWPTYAGMTDLELEAIWLYLNNLPAR